MQQWFFVFDPSRCIGCLNCITVCKLQCGVENRWVEISSLGHIISFSCNHCENPECFRVCREKSYRKRKDGIVIQDEKRCTGCGDCTRACPFKAPKYSLDTGKVYKCNFCYTNIDLGLEPSCIAACPTNALQISRGEPLNSVKLITGFPDALFTNPKIRFKNKNFCQKEGTV